MIELADNASERDSEQTSTPDFFADEERSGFGADEESFGSSVRSASGNLTASVPPLSSPEIKNDVAKQVITSSEAVTNEISSEVSASPSVSNVPFAASSFTPELSTPEQSIPELSIPEQGSAEFFAQEFAKLEPPTSSTFSASIATAQAEEIPSTALPENTVAATTEPPPLTTPSAQPLSEAQQLADMLAGMTATNVSSNTENDVQIGVEAAQDFTGYNTGSPDPTVISIPSESEIAKEQQRLLRKQELMDSQHRKKAQFREAERLEKRASGRTIVALVITTLLGAIATAGFFAWRNPALRTAAEEAWHKLKGTTSSSSASNTAQSSKTSDNAPSAAQSGTGNTTGQNNSSNNSPTPLDLTQNGSGKTVAAQDSVLVYAPGTEPSATSVSQTANNADTGASSAKSASSQKTTQNGSTPSQAASSLALNKPTMQEKSSSKETSAKATSTKGLSPKVAQSTQKNTPQQSTTKPTGTSIVAVQKPIEQKTITAKTGTEKGAEAKTGVQPSQTPQTAGKADKTSQKNVAQTKPSVEKLSTPYMNSGVFAIQVYASPSQADAEDWVERLRRRGFLNPNMSSQVIRGQVVYRVRFGLYTSLRDAERDAERYGFAGAWVVRLR